MATVANADVGTVPGVLNKIPEEAVQIMQQIVKNGLIVTSYSSIEAHDYFKERKITLMGRSGNAQLEITLKY